MTRQQAWRKRQLALGNCIRCGRTRDGEYRSVCKRCAGKIRVYARNRSGCSPQWKSKKGRPTK